MAHKAIFLDRDGTIVRDVSYCARTEDLEILPTVPEATRLLNQNGFKVVVITNQSGIARGYFSEATLAQIHRKMAAELGKDNARLDAIYYCPHHPKDGCECRKPGTALFRRAAREMDIDLSASFVIGDMPLDIEAGRALGCATVLVTTGPEGGRNVTSPADFTASSLLEAVRGILARSSEPSLSAPDKSHG